MALMRPPPVSAKYTIAFDDPRAAYFRQMEDGMYVRMACLHAILGKV